MAFTWQELIDRARVYIDDDHNDSPDGVLAADKWLTLANVEYSQLYARWIRMGLVSPAPTDTSFVGSTTTLTGCFAIQGVAQDLGNNQLRILRAAQPEYGRSPFWTRLQAGASQWWVATGSANSLTLDLEPRDSTGNYVVRWIPTVPYATDPAATIDLPFGGDERLALGIARRSNLKTLTTSAELERRIQDADAELNFQSFGRTAGDEPRVRRIGRTAPPFAFFPSDPRVWRYV